MQKRVVLIAAMLAGFLTPFDGSAVNIALPTIGNELGLDLISLSWISTAYLLASAVFLVPFGRIADIFGRKRIFLIGIAIFTISSFLMTLIPDGRFLIINRVFQGIGSAMIFGTSVSILTSVYPPGERGSVLGIYVTSVYVGLSVGPFIGGFLTSFLGWRSIFLINVPLGILTIFLITHFLKQEWADSQGERFDIWGSILYSLTLVSVMYGFSRLPEILGGLFIITGIFGLFLFIRYELKNPFPVLEMDLFFNNRTFTYSNLAALINYSATFAIAFLLSLDLQLTKGFTPEYAGFILIAQPVMQALLSTFSGRLSDRIEPRLVASTGMAITTFGIILLIFLNDTTPLWYYILSLLILGIGFGLFTSPNTNAVMSSVEKRNYGVASGTLGTMRLVGQMLSMGIAMMIFAIIIGPVPLTPDVYPLFQISEHIGFIFFSVLCFIGIFFSLNRGKIR